MSKGHHNNLWKNITQIYPIEIRQEPAAGDIAKVEITQM